MPVFRELEGLDEGVNMHFPIGKTAKSGVEVQMFFHC